jgi:ribosomal protein L2
MKKSAAVLAAVTLMFSASVCSAIELKGTQIKGNAGRNAEIKSATVKLAKAAKITKIEGGKAGLCIESPAEAPLCGEPKELIGKTLKPGNYTTYPNIPEGKESASVTVILK